MPTDDSDILGFGFKIFTALIVIEIIYMIAEDVLRKVSPSTHLPEMGWLIVGVATIGIYGIYYKVKR